MTSARVYDPEEHASEVCRVDGCDHRASNPVALEIHLAKDHIPDDRAGASR